MKDRDARTIQMIGEDGMAKLKAAKVLVVGVGGVEIRIRFRHYCQSS